MRVPSVSRIRTWVLKTYAVVVEHFAEPEELLPRDVAVVVFRDQHRPLIKRLANGGLV
jgi:hypothetical protein